MKTPFLLALPTMIACCAFAQERFEQPARTRLQCTTADKTITPLSGVQVKVENLELSDQDGKLKLSITPNKDKTYTFAQIQKSGYALIHPRPEDIADKKAFAHNANAELDIILRDDAELEEEVDEYATQGKSYYLERQKQLKQEMEVASTPERQQKLQQELDIIIERREQIMEDIEARARELASTDYLELNADEIERIELRKAGKLDELIKLINSKLAKDAEAYAKELRGNIQDAQQREADAQLEAEELIAKRNEQIKLLGELADVYSEQFNHQKAAECLKARLLYAPDNYEYHKECADLLYFYVAAFDEAFAIYSKCIQLAQQQFGDESEKIAISYSDIAAVYRDQGLYSKALEYNLKALAICEKIQGKNHPNIGGCYNNIGYVYYVQGEYDKALEYYWKALAIFKKAFGLNHPEAAMCYNDIALAYCDKVVYDKSLEYYFKALAIFEASLGTEHHKTAATYDSIGSVYGYKMDYSKALEYHLKALPIREKVLGKNHPQTATTYSNMGFVYKNQGKFDLGLEYYLKGLAIREKVLGKNHPAVATSYNNIAMVYLAQEKFQEAMAYIDKAIIIFEKALGKYHPKTKQAQRSKYLIIRRSAK